MLMCFNYLEILASFSVSSSAENVGRLRVNRFMYL